LTHVFNSIRCCNILAQLLIQNIFSVPNVNQTRRPGIRRLLNTFVRPMSIASTFERFSDERGLDNKYRWKVSKDNSKWTGWVTTWYSENNNSLIIITTIIMYKVIWHNKSFAQWNKIYFEEQSFLKRIKFFDQNCNLLRIKINMNIIGTYV